MAVAQRVSVDEALKRVVSHADVVGAGIMTSRAARRARRARRAARRLLRRGRAHELPPSRSRVARDHLRKRWRYR